jgi:hypothetical protein
MRNVAVLLLVLGIMVGIGIAGDFHHAACIDPEGGLC